MALPLFDTQPSTVEEARARGHIGAERAGEKADRISPSWLESASAHVRHYRDAMGNGAWLIEDARAYAESCGLPMPPDGRAWGSVTQALKRAGDITFAGFAASKSSNGL